MWAEPQVVYSVQSEYVIDAHCCMTANYKGTGRDSTRTHEVQVSPNLLADWRPEGVVLAVRARGEVPAPGQEPKGRQRPKSPSLPQNKPGTGGGTGTLQISKAGAALPSLA